MPRSTAKRMVHKRAGETIRAKTLQDAIGYANKEGNTAAANYFSGIDPTGIKSLENVLPYIWEQDPQYKGGPDTYYNNKDRHEFTKALDDYIIPMVVGYMTGTGVTGVGGGATVGGAVGGASQAWMSEAPPSDVTKAGVGGAVTGGMNSAAGGDPYNYGTSTGGRAGTAATTSGLYSAARGDTLEQQVRNASIAGSSTYAGGEIGEATGSQQAGKFGGMATNLGLQQLWEDPEYQDPSDYYNSIINDYTRQQSQIGSYDEPMIGLSDLENTPEGSRLLELFQQQEGTMQAKKSRAGGAGQFASSNDQLEQSDGQDTYLI